MPLRMLLYVSHAFEKYLNVTGKMNRVYGHELVKIPTPKLVVLYNGNAKDMPFEEVTLKLSDSFEEPDNGDLEAAAHVYNVNSGKYLPSICTPLNDYAKFVDSFRDFAKGAETQEDKIKAANLALNTLPDGDVKRYILSQKGEVIDMLLTEYNEQAVMDAMREEGEERLASLISVMAKKSDAENIQKAADDKVFRQRMYKKYSL